MIKFKEHVVIAFCDADTISSLVAKILNHLWSSTLIDEIGTLPFQCSVWIASLYFIIIITIIISHHRIMIVLVVSHVGCSDISSRCALWTRLTTVPLCSPCEQNLGRLSPVERSPIDSLQNVRSAWTIVPIERLFQNLQRQPVTPCQQDMLRYGQTKVLSFDHDHQRFGKCARLFDYLNMMSSLHTISCTWAPASLENSTNGLEKAVGAGRFTNSNRKGSNLQVASVHIICMNEATGLSQTRRRVRLQHAQPSRLLGKTWTGRHVQIFKSLAGKLWPKMFEATAFSQVCSAPD